MIAFLLFMMSSLSGMYECDFEAARSCIALKQSQKQSLEEQLYQAAIRCDSVKVKALLSANCHIDLRIQIVAILSRYDKYIERIREKMTAEEISNYWLIMDMFHGLTGCFVGCANGTYN